MTKPITLDGVEQPASDKLVSPTSFLGQLQLADARSDAGPSVLLALGALAGCGDRTQARALLTEQIGLSSGRAGTSLRRAKELLFDLSAADPLALLVGRATLRAQHQVLEALLPQAVAPDGANAARVSIRAAKEAWSRECPERLAVAASRSKDQPSMLAAAALLAGTRQLAATGFGSALGAALALPLLPTQGSGHGATVASRVLLAAYTLDATRREGLDLGATFWNDAPPAWRSRVAPWLLPMLDPEAPDAVVALLVAMRLRKLTCHLPGHTVLPGEDSTKEVLNLVRGIAQEAAPDLTRWFNRPMWFDGGPGQAQVLLTQDDSYAYAWVGRDGRGALVSFDTEEFFGSGLDEPATSQALAVAVAWYVDLSVSLKAMPSGSRTIRRAPGAGKEQGFRYVPTPAYHQQQQGVTSGRVKPLRSHLVAPFIRHLMDGQTPNPEQVALAPKSLQRRMGPGDTYVRGHLRGRGGTASEWVKRLSARSVLADVMGLLSTTK